MGKKEPELILWNEDNPPTPFQKKLMKFDMRWSTWLIRLIANGRFVCVNAHLRLPKIGDPYHMAKNPKKSMLFGNVTFIQGN